MKIKKEIRSALEGAQWLYVATADPDGKVHLAVSDQVRIPDEGHMVFEDWFCDQTLENLKHNSGLTVGVLDASGKGYQIHGQVEDVQPAAMMDGFDQDHEKEWADIPQMAHRLVVAVDAIVGLTAGPHSDEEIQ